MQPARRTCQCSDSAVKRQQSKRLMCNEQRSNYQNMGKYMQILSHTTMFVCDTDMSVSHTNTYVIQTCSDLGGLNNGLQRYITNDSDLQTPALQHRCVHRRCKCRMTTRTGGGPWRGAACGGLTGTHWHDVAHCLSGSGSVRRRGRAGPCRGGRQITIADFELAELDAAKSNFISEPCCSYLYVYCSYPKC